MNRFSQRPMVKESGCLNTVEIYQLAPNPDALMQSYVIKTSNGKLVVIDGGIGGDSQEIYLLSALRAIAGVGENEYFEVEAWFLSHCHNDHFFELAKMLNAYTDSSNYKINHIYFDFPPFETAEFPYADGEAVSTVKLKEGLANYAAIRQQDTCYDAINGAFINQASVKDGLVFDIDGVKFEILLTWDSSRGGDVNNQSLIIKMYAYDKTVLFLNDCKQAEGAVLLRDFADKIRCDVVQMAHHGQDAVNEEVYTAIGAKIFLWPTPIWVWTNTTNFTIGETRKWVNGMDFTTAKKNHIVACLYEEYPTNPSSVESWKKVKDGMKIVLFKE